MGDHRDAADGPGRRQPVTHGSPTSPPSLYAATPGRRAARVADLTAAERANAAASTYVGRRVARRAVDAPSSTVFDTTPLPARTGERPVLTLDRPVTRPQAPAQRVSRTAGRPDLLDTGTIDQVIAGLEPVDHSTSFADEATAAMPLLVAAAPVSPGKRRAVKHAGSRGPLFRGLPSMPLLLGVAALTVSAVGALTMGAETETVAADQARMTHASALTGVGGIGTVGTERTVSPTSRDSDRDLLQQRSGGQLADPVEEKAAVRSGSLRALATQAENFSEVIARNQWEAPLDSYRLTATYGEYGLWANYHTGLDFAAPEGTSISAVAGGVVTSAGYDGPYGNKTVITLEDGTEMWYCHQSSISVSTGDTVRAGEPIGYVGSTGNVTGPHLHLEVRPGGGDPVDPYAALVENGVNP